MNILMFLFLLSLDVEETGKPIEVIVENIDQRFVSWVESANESVRCALYGFEDKFADMFDSLDTEVEVIGSKKLKRDWYTFREGRTMHMKFCIRDEAEVWIGSWNPTTDQETLNNVLIIGSKKLSKFLLEEIKELYRYEDSSGRLSMKYNDQRLVVNICPEDECEAELIGFLGRADESIEYYLFTFTLDSVYDILNSKYRNGLLVTGWMEDRRKNMKYELMKKMERLGGRYDKRETLLHHKVFIVDRSVLITGSMNPTKNGVRGNDEVMVVVHSERVTEEIKKKIERQLL